MITETAFVCYPVRDMKRARAFYEKILGLKTDSKPMKDGGGVWVEYVNGGDAFALGKMKGFNPRFDGACLAFEVKDFDAMVKRLKKNKIAFKMGPMETPVCHMAMFKDTEGNAVMIHKRK